MQRGDREIKHVAYCCSASSTTTQSLIIEFQGNDCSFGRSDELVPFRPTFSTKFGALLRETINIFERKPSPLGKRHAEGTRFGERPRKETARTVKKLWLTIRQILFLFPESADSKNGRDLVLRYWKHRAAQNSIKS